MHCRYLVAAEILLSLHVSNWRAKVEQELIDKLWVRNLRNKAGKGRPSEGKGIQGTCPPRFEWFYSGGINYFSIFVQATRTPLATINEQLGVVL